MSGSRVAVYKRILLIPPQLDHSQAAEKSEKENRNITANVSDPGGSLPPRRRRNRLVFGQRVLLQKAFRFFQGLRPITATTRFCGGEALGVQTWKPFT